MEEHKTLTLGSLFDGAGTFCLGALMAGIQPVFSCEIEPFPIRVVSKRLPMVKHYGDISRIHGGELEPVDIITGGFPCQSVSMAGKRHGLRHVEHGDSETTRTGLFYEMVRIVKEMREATNGRYPRFMVAENVTGLFSCSKGKDFRTVLTEIVRIKEPEAPPVPMPEKSWPAAGVLMGDGFSLAYRTLDSQGWGVPQRRRRIYFVADFGGGCAGKVLFDTESVLGDTAARFSSWQSFAESFAAGLGKAGGNLPTGVGTEWSAGFCTEHSAKSRSIGYEEEKSPTLRAGIVPAVLNDQGGQRMDVTEGKTNTLRAESHHPPLVFENHSMASRYKGPLDVAPTVLGTYGTGGNNQPLVTVDVRLTSERTKNARFNVYETDVSRCLSTNGNPPDANQGGLAIVSQAREAYAMTTGSFTQVEKEKTPTLMSRDYKDPTAVYCGIGRDAFNSGANAKFAPSIDEEVQPPLTAKGAGAVSCRNGEAPQGDYIVRRLTPTECAALQGFPRWWCKDLGTENPTEEEMQFWREVFETHRKVMDTAKKPKTDNQIRKWLKDPHTDGAEYRMWGNGCTASIVFYVLFGIAHFAKET